MDEWALPAQPNVYGTECNGFRMRWQPGAFGDRETIENVVSFRVTEQDVYEDDDGNVWRTILSAEVTETSA